MTTPDHHALCAELVEQLQRAISEHGFCLEAEDALMYRARAALAQPEAEGATDKALASFTAYFCRNYPGPDTIIHKPEWHAPKIFHAAADAIARWGRSAIEPVPVSEGPWEREGWCDAEGKCWLCGKSEGDWRLMNPRNVPQLKYCFSHSLPHHALPVPAPEVTP